MKILIKAAIFTFLTIKSNLFAQPLITNFSPQSGQPGTTVKIIGSNFSANLSNNIVLFGNSKAIINSGGINELDVIVPVGAIYGPITVINLSTKLLAYSKSSFIPIFSPNKNTFSLSDFNPRLDFTTVTSPQSVASCDLDGDNKPEIIVTNSTSNLVSVFKNTSVNEQISFAARQDFSTGVSPYYVLPADFDSDGKMDLVIANNASNSISVLKNSSNEGTISFLTKKDFAVGLVPQSLAIGDINGDGKVDVVSANSVGNTFSVLKNSTSNAEINFDNKIDFSTNSTPYAVSISDIDKDQKIDVIVANKGNGTISVFRNTGEANVISFANRIDYSTGIGPYSIVSCDFDGDFKEDIAVADFNSGTVTIKRNTSSGTISFSENITIATNFALSSIIASELNGDGKIDLAVTAYNNDKVYLFPNKSNTGNISFGENIGLTTGVNPYSVCTGDFNIDGKPDLLISNISENNVSIFRNTLQPSIPVEPIVTSTEETKGLALKIYPNPISNKVFIESEIEIEKLELLGFDGRLVKSINNLNKPKIEINCAELPNGVYLIKIRIKDKITTHTIIKT